MRSGIRIINICLRRIFRNAIQYLAAVISILITNQTYVLNFDPLIGLIEPPGTHGFPSIR